jgi:hypothetical protein
MTYFPSPFSRATSAMLGSLLSVAGVPATYSRGLDSVALSVVPGSTRVETVDEEGTVVRAKVRDYKFRRADLVLAGSVTDPEVGDELRTTQPDGSTVDVWQVVPIGGDRHARPFDLENEWVRVHVQLIGNE